jgi:AGCS family alanine or glycine:cation symporter
MFMFMRNVLETIDRLLWGAPLIFLLGGTGLYFTLRLRLLQFFHFPRAINYIFRGDSGRGDVSHFASLCTALSSTIGTGNVIGVVTAIAAGGPGALLWMWVAGFFGMATKYAEGFLAIKYRRIGEDGKISGGPMYYIEMGTGLKSLSRLFAICGIAVALFSIGTFAQVNSITMAARSFGSPIPITTAILAVLIFAISCGGIRRIAILSEWVVPIMCTLYVGAATIVLILHGKNLIPALALIFKGAFCPSALFGGSLGVGVVTVMQLGASRGMFSNEAGMGSAAIAAAAAKTNSPVRQGLVAMTGVFFSMIICTMTGLVVIITSDQTGIFSHAMEGVTLVSTAFRSNLGIIGQHIVNVGLIFFAFTTMVGWNYYGEKCFQYLRGLKYIKIYRIVFICMVLIGPFLKLDTIFILADIINGCMAIPNLIGLFLLRYVIIDETKSFFAATGKFSK